VRISLSPDQLLCRMTQHYVALEPMFTYLDFLKLGNQNSLILMTKAARQQKRKSECHEEVTVKFLKVFIMQHSYRDLCEPPNLKHLITF